MMLPIYLLALAGFMLLFNLKAGSRPGKWASYVLMWAAVIGSAVTAFQVYT